MPIFRTYEKKQVSLLENLLKRPPRENARAEIAQLFSRYESNILEVPLEDIEAIARKYRIDLHRDFHKFRKEIFLEYLRHCLKDYHLDWEERKALKHLGGVLYLSRHDISQVVGNERKRLFRKRTRQAARDGVITEKEKAQLARIRRLLELDHSIVKRIKHQVYNERYQAAVKTANADQRVTDEEMKVLEYIAGNLGLDRPALDAATYELFNRYRNYWLIENGRLPIFDSDTILNHGERVHFKARVNWLKRKRDDQPHASAGLAHRVRYSHSYVFNHEDLKPANISGQNYEHIGSGTLQVTNHRLLFLGHSGNHEVKLRSILNVFSHSNGIDVQKKTGRSIFLEFEADIDLFSMTLNTLITNVTR